MLAKPVLTLCSRCAHDAHWTVLTVRTALTKSITEVPIPDSHGVTGAYSRKSSVRHFQNRVDGTAL